jgi:hypothetical protein
MLHNVYPGFNLAQCFQLPAIPIPTCQSKSISHEFSGGTVEFNYNSYGYRTDEFNKELKEYIVISGCSLTEGHGLHLVQTWGKKLEQQLNKPVVNLAKGGANAEFVCQNLTNWLNSEFNTPAAIIAQWPNPYRTTHWHNGLAQFILRQGQDDLYKLKIKHGEEYFYWPRVNSIVQLDSTCKSIGVPVLHLCFDTPELVNTVLPILKKYNIDLHLDLRQPDLTWHFDSSALDGCHHSEWCTTQWTKRILTLLKTML